MSSSSLRISLRRVVLATSAPRGFHPRPSFRKFSTTPPPHKSNTPLLAGLGAAVVGGLALYYFRSADKAAPKATVPVSQATKANTTFIPTRADYQKIYNEVADLFDEGRDYDDGSYGPVILRLAWHSSGTYDKDLKTGGSNFATMRFKPESLHGANAGLHVARDLLESIKQKHPWISYGDLWTLAGVAAIQEMAGPPVPWRPGRVDGVAAHVTPDGRLPDGSQGADHLRAVFYRMGFNDQEIVALSGAHAVGRCHSDRSGFHGPWTFSPTTFTNDFFKLLFEESWTWKKWGGPKQLEDKKTQSLMMLPTDFVLVQDKEFKKYAKAYAEDIELFFRDFADAVSRLFELGVPISQFVTEPWILKTREEQKDEAKAQK